MRLLLVFCVMTATALGGVPPELVAPFEQFRPDPPAGWSYTQTTSGQGRSTIERYDATKAAFERWSLVQQDGRAPTADETKHYAEVRSRWSRSGTAPKITDQLDFDSIERVSDSAERTTYRSRIRRGETGDKTADFLRATVVLHKPTQTIESIELTNTGEFSPTLAVKIREMKTTMTYLVPAGGMPALPQKVETRVRGRAFWVKSLDADMTVSYSDFKRPATKAKE